jgi:hypothetical protein
LHEIVFVLIHREEEDLGLRTVLADLACGLERRETGHADVHEYDVGL